MLAASIGMDIEVVRRTGGGGASTMSTSSSPNSVAASTSGAGASTGPASRSTNSSSPNSEAGSPADRSSRGSSMSCIGVGSSSTTSCGPERSSIGMSTDNSSACAAGEASMSGRSPGSARSRFSDTRALAGTSDTADRSSTANSLAVIGETSSASSGTRDVVWRPINEPRASDGAAVSKCVVSMPGSCGDSISSSGTGSPAVAADGRGALAGGSAPGRTTDKRDLRGIGASRSMKIRSSAALASRDLRPVFGFTAGSMARIRSIVDSASAVWPAASNRSYRLASCSRASSFRSAFSSWSASIRRMSSWSGHRSANSLSARNASSFLPAFCMRSAYSRKFCLASPLKPLAAEILPSL